MSIYATQGHSSDSSFNDRRDPKQFENLKEFKEAQDKIWEKSDGETNLIRMSAKTFYRMFGRNWRD